MEKDIKFCEEAKTIIVVDIWLNSFNERGRGKVRAQKRINKRNPMAKVFILIFLIFLKMKS